MKAKKIKFSFVVITALVAGINAEEMKPKVCPTIKHEMAFEPIIVNSDLRKSTDQKIATSTTLKDEFTIQDQGATHFESLILEIPNVNFSGQDSRPRHIQIRGMGERDEYTGAPNASVGFVVDDIDFSSIGMAASLFDVKQVEVLRGPQGTRYGNSALAGLIRIDSNAPTPVEEKMIEITGGENALREIGAIVSGPLSSTENSTQYRLAIQKHDDNGFRDNAYLNQDDTNGRDELTVRGKLRFFYDEETTIDLMLLHANLDNGYDAWSLDNSFTTLSDETGKDTQKTNATTLKITSKANQNFELISTTIVANSDMIYSYDGDWVYPSYWSSYPTFRYFYQNDKSHKTASQEIKLVSTEESKLFDGTTDWLIGLYAAKLQEENQVAEFGDDPFYNVWSGGLASDYQVNKIALFGQLDYAIDTQNTLSVGARVEHHTTKYTNDYFAGAESYDPNFDLFGGHIELSHAIDTTQILYASLSQGYKAGGFNIKVADPALLYFKKETARNYEIGYKTRTSHFKSAISAFYTDRHNPQFDGYTYIGSAYTYYTENFDEATNYGVEGEFDWSIQEALSLFGSVGLLQTTVDGDSASGAFSVDGREQSHAPSYQYSVGTQYRYENGIFVRTSVRGMDSFYFDNSHDQKSKSYSVADAKVGYETGKFEAYLWGRNLFDKKYATRGYYFANDPEYANTKQFVRLGDPRQLGVTVRYHF